MKAIFQKDKAGRLHISLIISGIIISIIHLISPYFPLKFLWGFSFYRFLPFHFQMTFLLSGILVCIPYINRLINRIINTILVFLEDIFSHLSKKIIFVSISSFFLIIFWIFRSRRLYGDGVSAGYVIKNSVYLTSDGLYNSIFVFSHSIISGLYKIIFGADYPYGYFVVFAFINCLFGSLFIIPLLLICKEFSKNINKKFFIFSILLSQGAIQIFFGHVESYAIPLTGGILFILLSFYYIQDRVNIFFPAIVLILTSVLKITAIQLYPALVLLIFLKFKNNKHLKTIYEFLLIVIIPIILLLSYLVLAWERGKLYLFLRVLFSPDNFLPFLNPKSFNQLYPVFSWDYLIAFLNELTLIFPGGILLTVFLFLFYRKKIEYREPYFLFLFCMSVSCLLYNLISYPILGPFRDWDKYSLLFLPVTLLGIYLLNKCLKRDEELFSVALIVLTFSLIHTVPWILTNNQKIITLKPETKYTYVRDYLVGSEYLKSSVRLINDNRLKNGKAHKWFALAVKFDINLGGNNDKLALEYYKNAIKAEPNFSEARNNLGVIYDNMGMFDKASKEFRKALDINPRLAEPYNNLGILFADWMWWDEAYRNHKKAIELKPDLAEAYNNLGIDYGKIGKYEDALAQFRKALILNPNLKPSRRFFELISSLMKSNV